MKGPRTNVREPRSELMRPDRGRPKTNSGFGSPVASAILKGIRERAGHLRDHNSRKVYSPPDILSPHPIKGSAAATGRPKPAAAAVPGQCRWRPEGIRTSRRTSTSTTSPLHHACTEQAIMSTPVTCKETLNPSLFMF